MLQGRNLWGYLITKAGPPLAQRDGLLLLWKQSSEEETVIFTACSEITYGSYNCIKFYYKTAFGLCITDDTNNIYFLFLLWNPQIFTFL